MYVPTTADNVLVLTYPDGKFVGTLSGFKGAPLSICSDDAGNVFVTASFTLDSGYVYEFKHGGTKPIATLSDPGFPTGCSVDPTSGDLAVANEFSLVFHHRGSLMIYTHARGKGKPMKDDAITRFYACSYDSNGNLFADGNSRKGYAGYVLLPKGGRDFIRVQLNQDIGAGGPIRWDGKYFAIGFTKPNTLYRVAVSGSHGTVIGELRLERQRYDMYENDFWIQGDTIVAPFGIEGRGSVDLGFWAYPAGGKNTEFLKHVDKRSSLISVTVSVGKRP